MNVRIMVIVFPVFSPCFLGALPKAEKFLMQHGEDHREISQATCRATWDDDPAEAAAVAVNIVNY